MQTKSISVEILKAAPGSAHDASFVMSAGTPDRVRDTIDPSAYDAAAASSKKLIALFNHDADKPIGYWEGLKRSGDTLVGHIKFASTNLAQMVKTLINDGVPLGASIGFRGKGEPNKAGGIHFKELNLLECSVVSIPAHPRAMQIAKSFGIDLQSSDAVEPTESSDVAPESVDTQREEARKKAAAALQKSLAVIQHNPWSIK